MSSAAVIFLLSLAVACLLCVIAYQQYDFRTGMGRKILEVSRKLEQINDAQDGGPVMVFTDHKELMELAAQINALLDKHRKVNADYCRTQAASKKMLSNISHDIKTPMTVILGYLEIMRTGQEASEEMLEKVQQKTQNVIDLINQFFTLAKLESGDMKLEISRIDVNEICRESILDFYEILTEREFEVEARIPETPVFVFGNKEGLQRILNNLISNAVRYGSDGKYIGLSVREDEKNVWIEVADKGKGIEKIFAESVFERLFTMEDSRSRSVQGNGLGLTIAKNLALQMGGTITLESRPFEKTAFTVQLQKG